MQLTAEAVSTKPTTAASQNLLNRLMEALFRLAVVCFADETLEVFAAEIAAEVGD